MLLFFHWKSPLVLHTVNELKKKHLVLGIIEQLYDYAYLMAYNDANKV